jgi:glycosyltransferase involved in cell wall biosynthesis
MRGILSDLAQDSQVTYIGNVPQTELRSIYARSDVLVLPSVSDAFGLVVLEAMSVGLPVVVSESVGASDLVQHGGAGLVIPARNTEAIQDALMWLYSNPAIREAMAGQALQTARAQTWHRYGSELLAAYDRVLEERGAR